MPMNTPRIRSPRRPLRLLLALTLALLLEGACGGRLLFNRERHGPHHHPQQQHELNVTVEDHRLALLNARPANRTRSLELITRVSLKTFEFKYDAIAGRTQLGPVGEELAGLLPEAVQVVPRRTVLHHPSKQRIALTNFHVVDKDSLFMHNVAATQLLIDGVEDQRQELARLAATVAAQQTHVDALQGHLEQEASVQLVERRRIAEAEVEHAAKRIEEARVRGEEERRTLEEQRRQELEVEEAKDALARRRLEDEEALRRRQNRDLVELQEASNLRLELTRRETEAVLRDKQLAVERERMALEHNASLVRAEIDAESRIRQQRLNQDIEMAQLQQRLEADRVRLLQALQATFDNVGQGMTVLLADPDKLARLVGGLVALAAGVYLSREAIRLAGKLLEQRLGKPSLVRETSRASGLWGFVGAWLCCGGWSRRHHRRRDELADVVLVAQLETRVHEIARSVRNAILHKAPYRHLLLYGPPGTGKTMVAKRLARASGMDYAILSGGDVGPLGSDAVTELHALFRWAKASPRGVLIFIDEAEAFLGCRATRKTHMSEAMRNALNALLYHTGAQSRHFMLVIATNRPEDLDTAVTDRIDDTLHFDLPERNERVRLLAMYFREYVGHLPVATKDQGADLAGLAAMETYGDTTEGMSGREIAKMMLYLQSIVYAQDVVEVSRGLLDRVIREKVTEHHRKLALRHYNDDGSSSSSMTMTTSATTATTTTTTTGATRGGH